VLFVNPAAGDDTRGNGTERSPFKTITQALKVAQPNTIISLAPGTYSTQTGEMFPLIMKSGVTIQGNPRTRGESIVIRGGATFISPTGNSQDITILGANQASLTGVTVTNPNPQGYGLWIESSSPVVVDNTFTGSTNGGISVKGNSAPTIRSNYFYDNGGDGITVSGTLQLEMRENVFENSSFGMNVAQNPTPQVIREPQVQSALEGASPTRPNLENNSVGSNNQSAPNNLASDPVPATFGNPLGEQTESSRTSVAAQNDLTQESNPEVNDQSPSPSAETEQLETSQPIMSLQVRESDSAMPMEQSDEPTDSSEATVPSAPTVVQPETIADSGSGTPTALENAQERPTQMSGANEPLANLPALSDAPDTGVQQSTEQVSDRNNPVAASPAAPEQPSTPVAVPQPTVNTEPSATDISAASFPVPSMLSTQNSALSSRVGSTPATPPQGNAARIPMPLPNGFTPSQPADASSTAIPSLPSEESATSINVIEFNEPLTSQPPNNPTSSSTRSTSSSPAVTSQPQNATESGGIELAIPLPENPSAQVPTSMPPAPATTAATPSAIAQSQRYRVLVEAKSETQQTLVRSLVPGAFRTVFNGQPMMQAGIFSTRENADEVLQLLSSNGLTATIEPVE
jgi:parallel beta-helix repeat protein